MARSANSRTASVAPALGQSTGPRRGADAGGAGTGQVSDGTWTTASPGDRERLAARGRGSGAPGAAASSRSATRATPSMRCSALSRTRSSSFDARNVDDEIERRPGRAAPATPRARADLGPDLARIAERGELRQPHAVREPRTRRRPATSSISRVLPVPPVPMSVTSRPRSISALDLGQLPLATDEGRQRQGQVRAPAASAIGGPETSPGGPRPRPGRPARAGRGRAGGASPGRAARRSAGSAVAGERGRNRREQDLAAVADREDPGVAVERLAEEVALARLGRPGVDRHPDPERAGVAPRRVAQRALGVERGRRRPRPCRRTPRACRRPSS